MSSGKWIAVCIFVPVVLFLAWALTQVVERDNYEDGCDSAGGVAVKSHLGPMVCIDRDALVDDGGWQP